MLINITVPRLRSTDWKSSLNKHDGKSGQLVDVEFYLILVGNFINKFDFDFLFALVHYNKLDGLKTNTLKNFKDKIETKTSGNFY